MIPLLLSRWRLFGTVALVAVIGVLGLTVWVQRQEIRVWQARAETARQLADQAIASSRRAEAGRQTLADALDRVRKAAEATQRASDAAKDRARARARAAGEVAAAARHDADARIAAMEARLGEMERCEQCEESLDWLVKEVQR